MIRLRRKSNSIFLQNKTGKSDAKSVWIGGDNPVAVQSMTTTDTADADATLQQVYALAMEGCEVVRVTVKDPPDAAGLPAIVSRSPVPIVADIHFDHKMALAAIEAGVAKLRLNPGNIRDPKKIAEVVTAAKAREIPIRVGVNMGSLAPDLEKTLGHTAEAMVESALRLCDSDEGTIWQPREGRFVLTASSGLPPAKKRYLETISFERDGAGPAGGGP